MSANCSRVHHNSKNHFESNIHNSRSASNFTSTVSIFFLYHLKEIHNRLVYVAFWVHWRRLLWLLWVCLIAMFPKKFSELNCVPLVFLFYRDTSKNSCGKKHQLCLKLQINRLNATNYKNFTLLLFEQILISTPKEHTKVFERNTKFKKICL